MALNISTPANSAPKCDYCPHPAESAVSCVIDLISASGDVEAACDGRNFQFSGAVGRVRARVHRRFCSRECLDAWWEDQSVDQHAIAAPSEQGGLLSVQHPSLGDSGQLVCDCGAEPDPRADRNIYTIVSSHAAGEPMTVHEAVGHQCPCELGAWWRAPAESALSDKISQAVAVAIPAQDETKEEQ